MKRKHSLCCIASARPRLQSWASALERIDDRAWRVRARACESANGGEERFCARSVARCQKYKMVGNMLDYPLHSLIAMRSWSDGL